MNRLLSALLLIAACDSEVPANDPPPSTRRFESVRANPRVADPDGFCDQRRVGDDAPVFAWPSLAQGSEPIRGAGRFRWVNLWATWCAPCVEEMPRLVEWHRQLAEEHHDFDLVFLSMDADAAAVQRFTDSHPEARGSLRIETPELGGEFLTSVGLDSAAPIPVHVFVDANDRVRCVRAGSVASTDLESIRAIVPLRN